jgi:hypothetical protein
MSANNICLSCICSMRCGVRDKWFNRLVDKTPASTNRWSALDWAKPYVTAEDALPSTTPVYKATKFIRPIKPLPVTCKLPIPLRCFWADFLYRLCLATPIQVLSDLRPLDALKVPHVAPKTRRKMQAAQMRAPKTFAAAATPAPAPSAAAPAPAATATTSNSASASAASKK